MRDARCASPCILHTFWSVSPPHWQSPAPMGSWRVHIFPTNFPSVVHIDILKKVEPFDLELPYLPWPGW